MFRLGASHGSTVERILKGTGSVLTSEDIGLYRKLVSSRVHVNGTLQMMSQWQLGPLVQRLPCNKTAAAFIVGEGDLTVPPSTSKSAADRMAQATFISLSGLGHLAHEEDAARVSGVILEALGSD